MAHVEDEERAAEDDPRAARIIRRMRLVVGVSTAIMLIGFMLVMSVIVWRLVKRDAPAGTESAATASTPGGLIGTLPIGAGARITGTSSDGQRLFVTVEGQDGRQSIQVFDAASLAYRGRIEGLAP
jgi:uncharacterized membrane protein